MAKKNTFQLQKQAFNLDFSWLSVINKYLKVLTLWGGHHQSFQNQLGSFFIPTNFEIILCTSSFQSYVGMFLEMYPLDNVRFFLFFFFPSSGSSKHTKSTSRVNFKAWSGTLWHLPVFSISSLIYTNVTRLCCLVYNISLQTPLHTLCCQLFPGNMFDFKELLGISMWLRSSTENKMYVKEQNSATYAVWLAGCFWKVQHRDAAELRAMKDGNEAEMNTLSPGSHQSCFIVSGILLI